MVLDQAFRLSSILLAAISVASLLLAIVLPPWLLTLAGLAFALALLRLNQMSSFAGLLLHLRCSALTWNVFLLLAFVGFWIDLMFVSQELLPSGIHFVMMLMVNKLSNLDHRRDFLHLYAISLISLLASAALTTQIWYAPFFLLYLVVGVWTLFLYHLIKERDEFPDGHSTGIAEGPSLSPLTHIRYSFFWTTNAMAAGAFGLTLLFFFSFCSFFHSTNRGRLLSEQPWRQSAHHRIYRTRRPGSDRSGEARSQHCDADSVAGGCR